MTKRIDPNLLYQARGVKGLKETAEKWSMEDDIKTVKHWVKKGEKILDLACGYGRITLPLAKAGYDIDGIDLSPALIKGAKAEAQKEKLSIRYAVGDMRHISARDNTYNAVVCMWNSYNHMLTRKDQIKVLNEIHRILTPSGKAFIVTRNDETKLGTERTRTTGYGPDGRIIDQPFEGFILRVYCHTRKTLEAICKQSRFKKYRVGFKAMNKRRRIVVYLTK